MPWNEALPTVILSKGVMHRGGGAYTQEVYTGRAGTETYYKEEVWEKQTSKSRHLIGDWTFL